MLMRRERREWTARRTLVLPQVMQAAMPRWRGLKWARMAGDCSTVSRKQRISNPVQMLEMLACAVCSWKDREGKRRVKLGDRQIKRGCTWEVRVSHFYFLVQQLQPDISILYTLMVLCLNVFFDQWPLNILLVLSVTVWLIHLKKRFNVFLC